MPFAPIPLKIVELIYAGFLPIAFQPIRGNFPLAPIGGGPAVTEHYELTSFNLPLSVYGVNLSPTPNPTQAWITVRLLLSGEVAFSQQLDLQLVAMGPGGSVTPRANAYVIGQMQTPIVYRPGQNLALSYELYFDQGLAAGGLGELALGGIFNPASTAPSGFEPTPGSIGYNLLEEFAPQ